MPVAKIKTALLVIDMQRYFLSMTTIALPNIITLSRYFRERGWPQFFTQHGHPESDFEEPVQNQLVRKWGVAGSLHLNTPDWELIPDIKQLVENGSTSESTSLEKQHSYPVIPKSTYDAFLHTDVEERLRREGVERVVIVGVMTDCCCDTTGRSAFNRGFETWMVSDATGSASKSQHEAGLQAWGFGYGDVIETEEAVKRLD